MNQPRLFQRAIRYNASIRKFITGEQLKLAVTNYVPSSIPTYNLMLQAITKLPIIPQATVEVSSDTKMEFEDTKVPKEQTAEPILANPTSLLPEVEVFLFTLIITTMLRYPNLYQDAADASTILIDRVRGFNSRSVDLFSSKAFFYFSLAYEKINKLGQIRSTLLSLYRSACLHHNEMGQAVLLNLLLRNYLQYNLIEQGQNLASKATFPENASNNQYCRYLYYMGRILAIQLEYSEALTKLTMAVRKAPQDYALGFSRSVQKLITLVHLLTGDIPERSTFNLPEFRKHLHPYLKLTQAVRTGDLLSYHTIIQQHGESFKQDGNLTLVHRLEHNVVKTGLRKISISYSKISLEDVALKLHLPSAASAEYICSKAIR